MQKKRTPTPNPYLEKSRRAAPARSKAGSPAVRGEVRPASRGPQPGRRSGAAVRRRRRRRSKLLILLVLSLFVVGIVLSFTVFFNVDSVVIQGETRYTKIQICTAGNVSVGDNLFLTLGKKARRDIVEKLPYIDEIKVERKLPSTLIINVTETPAFFAVYGNNEYVLLDGNMKVLEKTASIAGEKVVLIKGVELESSLIGKQLEFKEPEVDSAEADAEVAPDAQTETTRELIDRIIAAIISEKFSGLTEIDLTDRLHVKMTYRDRLVLIIGTPTELDRKFKFAEKAIEKLDEEAEGYIDLTVPQSAYYTTEARD